MVQNPKATHQALSILRSGGNFNFYVIFFLVVVLFIYFSEIQKKNWNGIVAGMAFYMLQWFFEICNALFQPATGHALWTIPTGTAFLILIGLSIELSLMFSIAGLTVSKILPEDPQEAFHGIPIKVIYIIGFAAFASIIEYLLAMTPAFVWVWEFWNALTVFIIIYIPLFSVACYSYYWEPKKQKIFIGCLALVNISLLVIFIGFLGVI